MDRPVDYPAVLSRAKVPVHIVGGWWTRGLTDFTPVGIYLDWLPTDEPADSVAFELAAEPRCNVVIGTDGAWWVTASGWCLCAGLGSQRTIDRLRQGQPPDDVEGTPELEAGKYLFSVCLLGEHLTDAEIDSLIAGCRAIQRAHHWNGHRIVSCSEWGKSPELPIDVDDIRRRIWAV